MTIENIQSVNQYWPGVKRLFLALVFLAVGMSAPAQTTSDSLPTVMVSYPPNGATVSGQTYITINTGFNLPLTGYESQQVYIDGNLLWSNSGNIDLVQPLLWNTVTATPGVHTIVATVEDALGNTVTTNSIDVTVSNGSGPDTTPPSIPANLAATTISCDKVSLSWVNSTDLDGSGVEAYTLYRNEYPYFEISFAADRAWFDDTDNVKSETTYTYSLKAHDFAGNTSAASNEFTVTTPACDLKSGEEVFDNADRQPSGRAITTFGSRVGFVYQKNNRFTGRNDSYLQLKDEDTGTTSNFLLHSDEYETDYILTSPTTLITLARTESNLSVNQYQLNGSPVPTSATLESTQAFGDTNSCPKSLFRLESGAVMAVWTAECGEWGSTTSMELNVAYRNPAGIWVDPLIVTLNEDTWKERIAVAQHPADGSIWVFNLADTSGRIGASHFTESANGLSLDWNNPGFIAARDFSGNIQDGSNGPGDEYPFLIAAPDPVRNTIDLAYQRNDNVFVYIDPLFQAGNGIFLKQNSIALAHISADSTKEFNVSPVYTERVAYFGLSVLDDGTIWLAYFPIDRESLTWNQVYAVQFTNGEWSTPAPVGSALNSIYNWSNSGPQWNPGFLISRPDQPQVAFRAPDSKIHTYNLIGTEPVQDTVPPSAPDNLTASNITASSVDLNWLASTDNIGVAGYNIYRCQGTGCAPVKIDTTSSNFYQDTGLPSATTYTYTVAAYDAGNNVSSPSPPVEVSTEDPSPNPTCTAQTPVLSVSPGNQSANPGATLFYTISLTNNDTAACDASDFDLTISSLQSDWSGNLFPARLNQSPGSTGTTTVSITSAVTATAGSYDFQIAVADAHESAHAKTTTATFVVNETTPADDTQAPTTPTGLSASETRRQVSLTWNASSDNTSVAGYQVWRDGVVIADTTNNAYTDPDLSDNLQHEYTVDAYDAAYNVSDMSDPVMAGRAKAKGKGSGKGRNK